MCNSSYLEYLTHHFVIHTTNTSNYHNSFLIFNYLVGYRWVDYYDQDFKRFFEIFYCIHDSDQSLQKKS